MEGRSTFLKIVFLVDALSLQLHSFHEIEQETLLKRALVLPAFEPNRQGPLGRAIADEASRGKFVSMHDAFAVQILDKFLCFISF